MMQKQQGFTLIELVVVIVILGLLAATALPRFIDATTNARVASLQGVAGGLRSAVSLSRSQYVLNGSKTATTVTMDGQTVNVLDETTYPGKGGTPDSTANGISVAMPNPDTNSFTVINSATVATYQPVSGGSATCQVTYTPANDPPVVVTKTGC